MQSSKKGCLH
nr:unnamed protein product [Callosobruchus chinensis]CAH7717245.1 unnamed protein product [Callosobruchus chinensis]CAH7721167.1 unnamed protein product [Callosobruchus chinensis]